MGSGEAFGAPGLEPRWTTSNKDGIGTAYSVSSRIWFTIAEGILTEIYWPTVDRPQVRDLQFMVGDGATFFRDERLHLHSVTERLDPRALAFRITNRDPGGRYAIEKEIICDPHYPCVLQRVALHADPDVAGRLRLFLLCAPHLDLGGADNRAAVLEVSGRRILTAERNGVWLALAADRPFLNTSCGFVGRSDGWTDLADNFELDWTFETATSGNVALTGELSDPPRPCVIGLALGNSSHNAISTLLQALDTPFDEHRARFIEQWTRLGRHVKPLERVSRDGGVLYASSWNVLMAHEDKTYPGALIASLSIPWGETKGDDDRGGYHLVWTRDLVNSVTALLSAGNVDIARRALVYLATSQQPDGGFAQNAWIDGEPFWTGVQLDEVGFPILLARRLLREHALGGFDPYVMVMRAAAYLVMSGPATLQERWEEASGFSPATLAVNIAALVSAASFARERGDDHTAEFLLAHADFLEQHVERWTVTTAGELVPGVKRHYIRIKPVRLSETSPDEDPNQGDLILANVPPGMPFQVPARNVVDAGFLALVRYGIRRADDPVVVDSLRVVDAVLRVDTPLGPAWRRYNHDGYGQRADGGPYETSGVGRAWPLLAGERGHYELAAGRDPAPFIAALERFAGDTAMLPEQVWDEADRPALNLFLGRPTGAARPLCWAHAEYITLLRSAADGRVFDVVPECEARYLHGDRRPPIEIWKMNRQPARMSPGKLRVVLARPFMVHWTIDEWTTAQDTRSTPTSIGAHYVDIDVAASQRAPLRFTFLWTDANEWGGHDYEVAIEI